MADYTRAHVFVRQELDGMPSKLISRALLSAALAVATLPAYGGTFKQLGRAESATPLTTYGMQVDPERAIKTVVPSTWQSSVHPGTPLVEKVSWEPADNWVTVLNRIADQNDAGVLIDWGNKRVIFRPLGVALEEEAKLEQARQAATTPLPAYVPRAEAQAASRPAGPPDSTPAPGSGTIVAGTVAQPQAGSRTPSPAGGTAPAASSAASMPTLASAGTSPKMTDPSTGAKPGMPPAGWVAPRTAPTSTNQPTVVAGANRGLQNTSGAAPSGQVRTAPPPTVVQPTRMATTAGGAPAGPPGSTQASAALAAGPMPMSTTTASVVQPKGPSAGPSKSFNDVPIKIAADGLATLHGYKTVWQAGGEYLPGPVTFMGENINEDFLLMSRALGPNFPILLQLVPAKKEIVARYKDPEKHLAALEQQRKATEAVQARATKVPASSDPLMGASATLAGTPGAATIPGLGAPGIAGGPAVAPGPRELVLDIKQGETLSTSLERFFKKEGWRLEWKVGTDLKAGSNMTLKGAGVAQVLDQLLPRLGMAADLYNPSKLAVIRVASYTPSKGNQ
jgi:hypothetical protein